MTVLDKAMQPLGFDDDSEKISFLVSGGQLTIVAAITFEPAKIV